jgi:Protein of unknown function (DUF3160)/FlgD Ig-like domain
MENPVCSYFICHLRFFILILYFGSEQLGGDMKFLYKTFFQKLSFTKVFVMCFLICFASLYPQASDNFNLDSYKAFLSSHQNMDADQLTQMYNAGYFKDNLHSDNSTADYYDSVANKFNLTDYEKSLINKNGFMVSERLSEPSFGQAFLNIYHKDLPVYISTDAILQALHISYDRMLKDVELGDLINSVTTLLSQLNAQMPQLNSKYSSNPKMVQELHDVDLYLTVARKLLDSTATPYYSSDVDRVLYFYNKAMQAQSAELDTLFASVPVTIDWSQFEPRGHYVDENHPILENYFRTMMWLGRIEIYLFPPENVDTRNGTKQNFADEQRQTIDAFLIDELFDLSNSWQLYHNVESILEYFVGIQDNVTIDNLSDLKSKINLSQASDFLDSNKVVQFADSLEKQSYANQQILSQILYSNQLMEPDSIQPASSFMLFGQRFVIDSYVTGSVVYDRITYDGEKICRLLPSPLDPMFALGNDAAGQLLQPELEQYHYATNLAALRYLINSYGTAFWDSTIYNLWLSAIQTLNPPSDRSNLPPFMQTAAFWQEKLNTQLASWAELRHDNLLYAKQSYTGGITCSYPHGYVEPFPGFYQTLENFANLSEAKFQVLPFSGQDQQLQTNILNYLSSFASIMDTLGSISTEILSGSQFTSEQDAFLHKVMYSTVEGCGQVVYDGWYPKLFYGDFASTIQGDNSVVADIHTVPTDCYGNTLGDVFHVGTGPVNLGVFVAKLPGGNKTAFVGPCLSFYTYTTINFQRLTDDEWNNQYLQSASRPSWVNVYLADDAGNSKGAGPELLTSIKKDNDNNAIPKSDLAAENYPNPFNPSTIIRFTIPEDLSNSLVRLTIYDINGRIIKTLVDQELPAGNYLAKWDGTNTIGMQVSSGIYIYNLRAADRQFSGKMTLLK